MGLRVASQALAAIIHHAQEAFPLEACGLLLGRGRKIMQAVATQNVHETPQTHFEIDPQALIDAHRSERAGGLELVGYYHSHPHGEARPSTTDQAMAAGDGKIWAIVGKEEVTLWRDGSGGFDPLPIEIIDS